MSDNCQILNTLEQMIEAQRDKMLKMGQEIVPTLTAEDMLQPNDYLELEHHVGFRYEEGIMEGLMSARMAIRALR